jgi:hypothetical protein
MADERIHALSEEAPAFFGHVLGPTGPARLVAVAVVNLVKREPCGFRFRQGRAPRLVLLDTFLPNNIGLTFRRLKPLEKTLKDGHGL